MQVSWIDPEEIAALAQQLRPARPAPPPKRQLWSAELVMQSELVVTESLTAEFDDTFCAAAESFEMAETAVEAPMPAEDHVPAAEPMVQDEMPEPFAEAFADPADLTFPTDPTELTDRADDEPAIEDTEPPAVFARDPAQSPELNAIRDQLQAIRQRAIGAGLLTPQSPPPAPHEGGSGSRFAEWSADGADAHPHHAEIPSNFVSTLETAYPFADDSDYSFEVPLGTIMQRLDAFAGWALRRPGGGDLLIVDQHGDLLWGPQAKAGLILSTMMACSAAMHASAFAACAVPPSIQQPLASGNLLTIIPCRTRLGMLQIAIARPDVVPAEEADMLRQALTVAIDTEGA